MFDYLGTPCPYCNKKFKDGDDIAVCPDCGTPHHRDCYAEHGECANTARHAEGYDWQQEYAAAVQVSDIGNDTFPCPACGKQVLSGSAFCNYCGTPFNGQISSGKTGATTPAKDTDAPPPPPTFQKAENYYESVLEDVQRSKEIDGISVKDWFTYIGSKAGYYLGYFKIQDNTGRKTAFTMSAMLFPVLYFLYRKVWLFAAAAFFSSMLFSLPLALITLHQSGMIVLANPTFWTTLGEFGPYLSILVNLVWGLFAVNIYRNASGKRIKTFRLKSANEQEFQDRLTRASGPSAIAVSLFLMCLMILSMVASSYLGINLL